MMPSVGSIVLYHDHSGRSYPAIVQRAKSDFVDLLVPLISGNHMHYGVEERSLAGGWSWPARDENIALTDQIDSLLVGDVVYLKSGSPAMTVQLTDDERDRGFPINCVWYDAAKQDFVFDTFRSEILTKVRP